MTRPLHIVYTWLGMPKKSGQLHIRASAAEIKRWNDLAGQSDMTVSEWIRRTLNLAPPLRTVK